MREERGQLAGDVIFSEACNLWGSVGGNVTVVQNGKVYVRGAIYGNLTLEYGGRVHIYGNVTGSVTVQRGAKLIHSGVVGGDLINDGGRLFVERGSKVMGNVKTISGETDDHRPEAKT